MKYSAEEFSLAGDQFLGRSYDEMDCQELVERMMAAVGYKRDLGGSNSWYRECMKNGWAGTPEECLREFGSVPKGALLFIREDVSASTPGKFRSDGIGDITHMGVKTGRGDGAIHSSHSRGCVCTSKFKDRAIPNGGWNRVGLLDVFEYGNVGDGSAVPHSRNGQNRSLVPNGEKEEKRMKGTVTAKSGSTVKLRQKPSTDCPIYWNIPVGTEMEIVDQRENWSKCICGGLTGWMKKEYIGGLSAGNRTRTAAGVPAHAPHATSPDSLRPEEKKDEDFPIAPEPTVSEDPSQFEDAQPDPELEQALTLLADVYQELQDLCERILSAVGRG